MIDDGLLAHHRLRAALARFGCRHDELDDDQRAIVDDEADRSLAIENAVLASPEAVGVFVPEASLDGTVEDVRSRYDTPEDFAGDMRANGLTPETLRGALRRELMVEAVLEKLAAAAPVASEADIHAWYDAHPDRFDLPETRTARHILLTVNDDLADTARSRAFERINALRYQLDGTLQTFHNLAYRHSECPSALEGGRLGRVPRGTLYPQLDAALFTLAEGSTSGVLESEIGFHIVHCEKIHPARTVPFEEAREKIRAAMNKKSREKRQTRWLGGLINGKRTMAGKHLDNGAAIDKPRETLAS